MTNSSLGVQFSNQAASSLDNYLKIEQEDYASDTGVVTASDVISTLSVLLGISNDETDVYCGMNEDGESFDAAVYVYPYPKSLFYDKAITHGTALQVGSEIVRKSQRINFKLDNTATLDYPVSAIISRDWVSDKLFKADGTPAIKQIISVNGQEVSIPEKVYGSVDVVYTTYREVYKVFVPARADAVENFFQSLFYCRFDGGIETLSIEAPPNAEDNYAAGTTCSDSSLLGKGGGTTIISPDGSDTPTIEPSNKETYLNYCLDVGHE